MLWNSLGLFSQSLFEDTTITRNFLKSHICKTSYIEINTLFVTYNNKESGISDQLIVHLKELMMVNGKSF